MTETVEITSKILDFFNNNEGVVNSAFSLVSLIIAIVAVIISIKTRKNQTKVDLFEKRYEIYSRFSELINMAKFVTLESFTSSGKIIMWNTAFFGKKTESCKLGTEIIKLDDRLKSIDKDSEDYKTANEERNEKVREKFFFDYSELEKDRILFQKCKLLFPNDFSNDMKNFFEIYDDVVFSANYMDEEYMVNLFERWRQTCLELDDKKYIEKMQKLLKF